MWILLAIAYIFFWTTIWAQLCLVLHLFFNMLADCYYGAKSIRYKAWLFSLLWYVEGLRFLAAPQSASAGNIDFDPEFSSSACFELFGFSNWQTLESFQTYYTFINPEIAQWFCEPVPSLALMYLSSYSLMIYLDCCKPQHEHWSFNFNIVFYLCAGLFRALKK